MGIILLLALALLAYGVFRIGSLLHLFAHRYTLFTLVPNAIGLTQGAAVTLAGQRVGEVKQIEFIPVGEETRYHLILQLSVDTDAQTFIRTDSEARIRTQGLLGDRYVDILPGTPAAAVLQPGDTLPSVPPFEMEEILTTAAETLEEARATFEDLRRITNSLIEGEGTLGRLLTDQTLYERMVGVTGDLHDVLAEINRSDGTLGRLIRDPALYEQMNAAVARIDSLGARLLEGKGTLGRLLTDDEIYKSLLGVVGRADTTIATLGLSLERLTTGEGTLQRFLTDPALYDQFLKAIVDLQTLINDIRENPRRYRPEVKVDIF